MTKQKTSIKSSKKRKIYKVVLSRKAKKKLNQISQKWQGKILITLHQLKTDPLMGKKLEGRYKNDYSIRVWPYRIIYTIKKQRLIIEVIEIEHRGGAYRK